MSNYGEVDCEDGPFIEGSDSHEKWWTYGKCHLEDGHAIERVNEDNNVERNIE